MVKTVLWQCPQWQECQEKCDHKKPHRWMDGANACDYRCKGQTVYCRAVQAPPRVNSPEK